MKASNLFSTLIVLISVVSLSSCYYEDDHYYQEPIGDFRIDLPHITELGHYASQDVYISFGGNHAYIEFAGPEDKLRYLDYDIRQGKLSLYRAPSDNSVRINLPHLRSLHLDASGDIRSDDVLFGDLLEILNSGSGDIVLGVDTRECLVTLDASGDVKLTGHTRILDVLLDASGELYAGSLIAADAYLKAQGSGDMSVFVERYLEASICSSGDIVLRGGRPEIVVDDQGSGDLYY